MTPAIHYTGLVDECAQTLTVLDGALARNWWFGERSIRLLVHETEGPGFESRFG